MEDANFDTMTRLLARRLPRRTGFGVVAALAALGLDAARAKSKRRHGRRSTRHAHHNSKQQPSGNAGSNAKPTCGKAGATCTTDANCCNGLGCVNSVCAKASCPNGQIKCGGSCCAAPANATPTCSKNTCGFACNNGFTNCSGACVDLKTDPAHCGTCTTVCSGSHATMSCADGMCAVAACSTGFADCDSNPSNGCETDVTTVTNCGACGHVCNVQNGTPGCTSGTCVVASCNAGFADCNNNSADGCEVNISSDPNNCGTCGHVCSVQNGTPSCANGLCAVAACNAGFADCDSNPGNGCEVHVSSDPNNCGACGHVCPQGQACLNGACSG